MVIFNTVFLEIKVKKVFNDLILLHSKHVSVLISEENWNYGIMISFSLSVCVCVCMWNGSDLFSWSLICTSCLQKPLLILSELPPYRGVRTGGLWPMHMPYPSQGKHPSYMQPPFYCSTNIRCFHILTCAVLVSKPRKSVWWNPKRWV
jgi:hypothetical protein